MISSHAPSATRSPLQRWSRTTTGWRKRRGRVDGSSTAAAAWAARTTTLVTVGRARARETRKFARIRPSSGPATGTLRATDLAMRSPHLAPSPRWAATPPTRRPLRGAKPELGARAGRADDDRRSDTRAAQHADGAAGASATRAELGRDHPATRTVDFGGDGSAGTASCSRTCASRSPSTPRGRSSRATSTTR